MKLDKEQARIDRLGVVISDEDKLQFYMEQIYASNCFDKKEMVDWENKPGNTFRRSPAHQSPPTRKQPNLQPTPAKNPRPKTPSFKR